jgi:hypothetical protein
VRGHGNLLASRAVPNPLASVYVTSAVFGTQPRTPLGDDLVAALTNAFFFERTLFPSLRFFLFLLLVGTWV